jgi:hypothetical protein
VLQYIKWKRRRIVPWFFIFPLLFGAPLPPQSKAQKKKKRKQVKKKTGRRIKGEVKTEEIECAVGKNKKGRR